MQEFRTVKAWQLAHQLTLDIHVLTESFPKTETLGMVMQLRRMSLLPPQRVAEACGQAAQPNKLRALGLARASQVELEYLLLLSHDLGLVREDTYARLLEQLIEARKMLSGLIKAVERSAASQLGSVPSFES